MLSCSVIESDLETTHCLLCKSSKSLIVHTFRPFTIVICEQCSLIYLTPRLKETVMRSIYQSDTYFLQKDETGYDDYSFQENSLRITYRRFLKELQKHGMTSGRLLEIGTGYGYFLDEARGYFQDVSGVELSERAACYAHKISGCNIHVGTVSNLPVEWNNFDVIVLINVIEHIYEPLEFLLSVRQRLKDDGRIVIGTPDIGSFWFKILKKRWPSFKIPEHVAFYSKKTLTLLLQKAGFKQIQPIPYPHAFPVGLIMRKLRVNISSSLSKIPVWIPKTMIALSARNEFK